MTKPLDTVEEKIKLTECRICHRDFNFLLNNRLCYDCQRCIDGAEQIEMDEVKEHTEQHLAMLLEILEHNKDDMTGLYDYDGIAQEIIDLVKK